MGIYAGISNIFQQVTRLFQYIMGWFSGIDWSIWTDTLPIQFSDLVSGLIVVLVTMAAIGAIKKLSLLLG